MITKVQIENFIYWRYVGVGIELYCFSLYEVLKQLDNIYNIKNNLLTFNPN